MSTVSPIEFSDALVRLQGLLGRELRVIVHFHGSFGAATLEGCLSRVQTLPPDHCAINVLLDDRQGLMLDPIDTEVLSVEDHCDGRWWLEFHLPSGVMAEVEAVDRDCTTERRAVGRGDGREAE